ncbi:MAG TPA: alpha-1,4-glucan--maltose-1-phosphate maltosyltransferase [Burkholderiales bacterium]|jgi:starch synthase (maltosyl-transferring)
MNEHERMPPDGRIRAIVEDVSPMVDGGRFAVKRVLGDEFVAEADCFTDGHDQLVCLLHFRHDDDSAWNEARMLPLGNDRWRAAFTCGRMGTWHYRVSARVDAFLSWRAEFARRVEAEDMRLAARIGADLITSAAQRAAGEDGLRLGEWVLRLLNAADLEALRREAMDESMAALVLRCPDTEIGAAMSAELRVTVDRERARYSTWYELFPRSAGRAGEHGTFDDVIRQLPEIAGMGFDVLYLPPIHPIGREQRKGKNNTLVAQADDVGSPWAIGASEGGHKSILPQLGTHADFRRLVAAAREHGVELALDIAFQCAPDHPYVRDYPAWFRWRPDGKVQYAENPPKKYQDIYPFDFTGSDWQNLWFELGSVFEFWIGEGVRIFRVDNPHTKPFPFWEWVIASVKRQYPDVIFLAEAFTRPRIMHRLAKLGFSQSYTYFAWRNTKYELTQYFTELCLEPGREYFRPNCWPNTPDILTEHLQYGGPAAFMARVGLAATLSANYGLYGPAYELMDAAPREHGSEEYLNSEKYQLRAWDRARGDSLGPFIARLNHIRRDNPALQSDWRLRFHPIDNEAMICYSKTTPDLENVIITVVNLDPHNTQSGWVSLDLDYLQVDAAHGYQMHELLTGARYLWNGARNFVRLEQSRAPVQVFHLGRHQRTERDFDYFL